MSSAARPAARTAETTQTLTVTQTQTSTATQGSLRLVLQPSESSERRVMWCDDVVDNEHLGRKKSKSSCAIWIWCGAQSLVCCIYHKARKPGEFDSDSDSSTDEGEDGGPNAYEREPAYVRKKSTSTHGSVDEISLGASRVLQTQPRPSLTDLLAFIVEIVQKL